MPEVGRNLFSLGEPPKVVNPKSNPHHSEKRLQWGKFRKGAFSNILSSQSRLAINTWSHHPKEMSLQHYGPSSHQVTPAEMLAGNAARFIRERSDNDSAHRVEIVTNSTLSQHRRLVLYTKASLTDIAHQAHEVEWVVEYACATTNVQTYSFGGGGN